jgi:hypothetical protein
VLARVHGVTGPAEVSDPAYAEGLRGAVEAAIDHTLSAIEGAEEGPPPIPPALLVQARLAARNDIGLDTVLRRCFAGHALLLDFLVEEAQGRIDAVALRRLLRRGASLFDALLAAIGEEYRRAELDRPKGSGLRRLNLVRSLLDGELLDAAELEYDFEMTHLALIARGPGAAQPIEALARALDARLLLASLEEWTTWAWIGGRRAFAEEEVDRLLRSIPLEAGPLALGEPGEGLAGWRLSHRQARAALPVASLGREPVVRYGDVALVSSLLQDELLATSLRRIYLDPLSGERDGGALLRSTLRAYLAAGRNVSSAAAALEVKRHTVANRIRVAEERIGRPLQTRMSDLDAVLRLEDLRAGGGPESGG